jgi:hypothetical protein
MNGRTPLPDALRRALVSDHGPVRPLRPAGRRAVVLVFWTALLMGVLPVVLGLRPDAGALGMALTWGAAVFECAVGLGLVGLALREAVPGAGIPAPWRSLAIGCGFATEALVAVLCWLRSGMPRGLFPPSGASCFPFESALGLPALALTVLLVARAYAVRPRWAGLLGGAGSGLLADGVWHLICPHADLAHLLLWHGGAVLALTGAGWLAGFALDRLRRPTLPRVA